jgi:glyoxylate reductase
MSALLPGPARRRLEAAHDVVAPERGTMPRATLLAEVRDAHGLITLLTDPVDAELLDAAPRLAVVANYAVGHNNVDLAAATTRGIAVTNTPDVLTESTADLAFALLLAAARRLVEGDALVRRGEFVGWGPEFHLGVDVHGATLGVVGFGRIGRAVARRALGFGMRVICVDPRRSRAGDAAAIAARRVPLAELLEESDFVSLHCPLLPATHHLIDAAALRRMKPGAILVNTARGPLVDEAALAAALREGIIAGAALDVFEDEPRVHPVLLTLPQVVLAPHIGSATVATRRRMAEVCVGSVLAVLEGRRPANCVNPEVYRCRKRRPT